jgi:hypothetical protein
MVIAPNVRKLELFFRLNEKRSGEFFTSFSIQFTTTLAQRTFAQTRVTRLGEFSPLGWLFTLSGYFWKYDGRSGVDFMITIFCDFRQFLAKKLAFFSKTNVIIKILHNLALFWVKNANFLCQFFWRKCLLTQARKTNTRSRRIAIRNFNWNVKKDIKTIHWGGNFLKKVLTVNNGQKAQKTHSHKDQGSMLWSQFSAIFDNFRRKNWRLSQKPMLWLKFLQKLAAVWAKNANIFAKFFAENI